MSSHGQCDLDHLLKLSSDPLKVVGTLYVEPMESVQGLSVDAIEAFLIGNNVRSQYIDKDAIAELIESVIEAPLERHSKVVARGIPAVNGQSAKYTLTPDIEEQFEQIRKRKESLEENSGEPPVSTDSDESDAVNFYDQMAFVVVHKGDVIAKKTERSEGSDGIDIFGANIPSHEGKPNDGLLDTSITVQPDGACVANVSGVFRVQPDVMFISNELEIRGDVDFSTGRIRFPGSVDVHGAVRDKFCVCTDGPVTIRGLVEAADVESNDCITLNRGMAGKDTGTVTTSVDLNTGYLEAVKGTIGRDLIVKSEITNCELSVDGQIKAENAAIRGGIIHASKGGSVGSIGSVQNVPTELVIGSLPDIESQLRTLGELEEKLESKIKSATANMEQFSAAIAKPTASQIEEQMGMQFDIDEMNQRLNQLHDARKSLIQIFVKHTKTRLEVSKGIYSKVTIYIPGHKVEFQNEVMGDSIIELGPTGHPSITYRGQTVDLKEHARVVSDDRVLRVIESEGSLSIAA